MPAIEPGSMPDHHIFLSDVHYGAFSEESNRQIEADLLSLVDFCMDNRIRLHILGDLFDYWMEYPGYHPDTGYRIIEKFRKYADQSGRPVLYITGNHDNWTRGYFETAGFDVESEYRRIRIEGTPVFLHHGDGLKDPRLNLPRPMINRILRHPLFIKIYQWMLPPTCGLSLMRHFSGFSRARPVHDPERLNSWAEEFLSKNSIDFVICGHDHIPRVESCPSGTLLNSGPFFSHRTVIRYTKGSFELVVWDSEQRQLTPYKRLAPYKRSKI